MAVSESAERGSDRDEGSSPSEPPPTLRPLAAALTVYLVLGGLAALGNLGQVNPDGLSYLRLAACLAEGAPSASVSGYWSPLLIWSLAPLLAFGVKPLIAARVVLLVWGALGVVASRQLALQFRLPAWPRALALCAIAVALADLATRVITPDVVIGSCLLAYAAAVSHPKLLEGRRACVACALGGLAFFAKSYALPFVLVHFPLSVYLRYRERRSASPPEQRLPLRQKALRAGAWGIATFFLVLAPWVAVLSWKHSRLTWSTVGSLAHAAAGPGNAPGTVTHPLRGLRDPPSPHLSIWERPELLPYPKWSPLASSANALHQVRVVLANLGWSVRIIASWDALFLGPAFLLLGIGLSICGRSNPELRWLGIWLLGTFVIYCGGYLLVYVDERYLSCFLLPLTVLWAFRWCRELTPEATPPQQTSTHARRLALAVLCGAFAFYPTTRLVRRSLSDRPGEVGRRRVVRYLESIPWEGSFAILISPSQDAEGDGWNEDYWREGQRISFFLQRPFAGADLRGAVEAPDLDRVPVQAVLHYAGAGAPELELGRGWGAQGAFAIPGGRLEVWVRR